MPRKTSRRPRKSYRKKSTTKTSRRPRKSYRKKSTTRTSRRPRKTYRKKSTTRKTYNRTPSKKISPYSISDQKNEYVFSVWYDNKPKVNKKFTVTYPEVKLDDYNEWLFRGFIEADSKEAAKSWLRSLGSVKRYSGTNQERLEI
jgi:hypothetical protein